MRRVGAHTGTDPSSFSTTEFAMTRTKIDHHTASPRRHDEPYRRLSRCALGHSTFAQWGYSATAAGRHTDCCGRSQTNARRQ
jgi:hypothetical protein